MRVPLQLNPSAALVIKNGAQVYIVSKHDDEYYKTLAEIPGLFGPRPDELRRKKIPPPDSGYFKERSSDVTESLKSKYDKVMDLKRAGFQTIEACGEIGLCPQLFRSISKWCGEAGSDDR